MLDEDARAFITQVAPLGTMDYSLLQKRPPVIDTKYGFSLPVPQVTLGIGIVVIILLIAGVALGCICISAWEKPSAWQWGQSRK